MLWMLNALFFSHKCMVWGCSSAVLLVVFESYLSYFCLADSFSSENIQVYFYRSWFNVSVCALSAFRPKPWAWTSELHLSDGPLASGSQRRCPPGIQAVLSPRRPIRGLGSPAAPTWPAALHHRTQWVTHMQLSVPSASRNTPLPKS